MRSLPRIAAILSTVVIAAACSSTDEQDSSPSSQTSASSTSSTTSDKTTPSTDDGGEVDTSDADAVAEAVALAAVTWDTSVDKTETAALIRVKHLCTPELAATFVGPAAGSGAYFNEAYAKQAKSEPVVTTTTTPHQPKDTDTQVFRAYTATWSWTGDDGTTWPDPRTRTMYLTVTKQSDDTWLISTYDHDDQGG